MYRKASKGWVKHMDFMLWDLACLYLAFFLVYYMRNREFCLLKSPLYRRMALVLFCAQAFAGIFCDTFKNVLKRGYYQELIATFRHLFLITTFAVFYLFMAQEGNAYSRLILVFTGVVDFFISYSVRCIWKKHILQRGMDKGSRSLLILTSRAMLDAVAQNVKKNNYEKFYIAGIALIDADMVGQVVEGIPIVANAGTVLDYVCRRWVDEVFINLPKELPLPEELINQLIEAGVTTHLTLMCVYELEGKKQNVERLGNYTVLTSSITRVSLSILQNSKRKRRGDTVWITICRLCILARRVI